MSKVIVGKIYAEWCGACKALAPEWSKMEKHAEKHAIQIVNIESDDMDAELKKLNETHGTNVSLQGGFPTIFKIVHGKVEYYNGERSSAKMLEWAKAKNKSPTKSKHMMGGKRNKKSRRNVRTTRKMRNQ
jgi:thiol-disulfide isomerase/thioredoxin